MSDRCTVTINRRLRTEADGPPPEVTDDQVAEFVQMLPFDMPRHIVRAYLEMGAGKYVTEADVVFGDDDE